MAWVEFANETVWDQATLFQKALSILGTDGSDFLVGTRLQETFSGGLGDDMYYRVDASDTIIEVAGEGIDTVEGLDGVVLPENVENLTLFEDGTLTGGARRGTGNAQDNILIGNTADNVLDGGDGSDTLIGGYAFVFEDGSNSGDGSDILIGGAGDDFLQSFGGFVGRDSGEPVRFGQDLLIGSTGNDTYRLSYFNESIIEGVAEGTDTVISAITYTLGQNLENLRLVGSSEVNGTGNDLNNLLIGNSQSNVLTGAAGDDTLSGDQAFDSDVDMIVSGNDLLVGGSGHDTYLFNVGDEIDTIEDVARLGEGNRIQFGTGVTQADLTFTQDQAARTLTIQVGTSGTDQLILKNFDPTNADGSLVVETLAFADGTNASLAALLGLGGPVNHAPTVATPLGDQTVQEDAPSASKNRRTRLRIRMRTMC